jgi:hypothetical protein
MKQTRDDTRNGIPWSSAKFLYQVPLTKKTNLYAVFSELMITFFFGYHGSSSFLLTCPIRGKTLQVGGRLRALPTGNSQRFRSGWISWKFSNVTAGYWCCWSSLVCCGIDWLNWKNGFRAEEKKLGDIFHNCREPEMITSSFFFVVIASAIRWS